MTVVKYPLATEKSIRQMESENKLVFVVDMQADRNSIKKDMEELFGAKVTRVNTQIDSKGRKKAYVQFSEETPAIDVATKLGLM